MLSTITQTVIALTQSMELAIFAKATVVLTLGLAAVRLAARAPASVRHLLLTATFAALIALPLAAVIVPGVVIEVPVANANSRLATASAASLSERPLTPETVSNQAIEARSTAVFDDFSAMVCRGPRSKGLFNRWRARPESAGMLRYSSTKASRLL